MSHSATPWTVQRLERERHGHLDWNTYTVRSAENVCLAVVGDVDRYQSHRIPANAMLMAAAPDLLAVCHGMLGYLAALPLAYRPDDAWFKPVTEALRKAEGA